MSMPSVPMLAFPLSTRQLIWSMLIFQCTCIIGLAYGVKRHLVPRKTVEGLKIKRHIPLQIGPSLQWGSVYLPSVAQTEAVGWIPCVSAFSHSKLNKHLLGWSCEHLLSSAPSVPSCSLPSRTCFCSAVTKRQTLGERVVAAQAHIYFLVTKCTCVISV